MLHWTLKSLLADRRSVAAAAIGIALALILSLYLDAVLRGEARQIVAFLVRTPADVWVLQKGVENVHMSRSIVTENAIAQVERVPGVRHVVRVVYQATRFGEPGQDRFVYVAGIPADAADRRLWQDATGWTGPAPGEAIVPEALARRSGLAVGGRVQLGDEEYVVGGLSAGTFSMANPLVFLHERDARRQFERGDGASILLVLAQPGVDRQQLASAIEAETDDIRALPRDELIANDRRLSLEMAGNLVRLMGLIGTGVAAMIVIFAAYAFVSVRSAELAVAKALGAPRRQLLLSALLQTGVIALLGSVLALAAIWPMQAALAQWVPDVAVEFSTRVALRQGMLTLLVAELAALVPVVQLLRIDPALVFKA